MKPYTANRRPNSRCWSWIVQPCQSRTAPLRDYDPRRLLTLSIRRTPNSCGPEYGRSLSVHSGVIHSESNLTVARRQIRVKVCLESSNCGDAFHAYRTMLTHADGPRRAWDRSYTARVVVSGRHSSPSSHRTCSWTTAGSDTTNERSISMTSSYIVATSPGIVAVSNEVEVHEVR